MMKKEKSKILLKLFELYELDFSTLSFQSNLKPYAKIKSIIERKGKDNFIIVELEDSEYNLSNCLIGMLNHRMGTSISNSEQFI